MRCDENKRRLCCDARSSKLQAPSLSSKPPPSRRTSAASELPISEGNTVATRASRNSIRSFSPTRSFLCYPLPADLYLQHQNPPSQWPKHHNSARQTCASPKRRRRRWASLRARRS